MGETAIRHRSLVAFFWLNIAILYTPARLIPVNYPAQ